VAPPVDGPVAFGNTDADPETARSDF